MTDLTDWTEYVEESELAYERAANRQESLRIMEGGKASEGYWEAVARTQLSRSLCEARHVAFEAWRDWMERVGV